MRRRSGWKRPRGAIWPTSSAPKWTAKDGEEEEEAVAAALAKLIGPSRAEAGNLAYQVHRDPEDRRVLFLYEQYVDAAAYVAHGDSPHFRRHAVEEGFSHLASRERSFYETWEADEADDWMQA